MARRRKATTATSTATPHARLDAEWERNDTYAHEKGELVARKTMVTIRGERGGRFQFLEHVVTEKGAEWLTFVGGADKCKAIRSFRADRISRVLRGRFV